MAQFKVLIADDDEDDFFILKQVFEELADIDVKRVGDGVQLIRTLESSYNESVLPDLILTDINMPKLDGIQALEFLKTNEKLKELPVIVYSTSKNPAQRKKCFDLGADGFISKGCSQKEIKAFALYVTNFLNQHKKQTINDNYQYGNS